MLKPEPRLVQSHEASLSGHSITADEISDGGASHQYSVSWLNQGGHAEGNGILFQQGPVKEVGHNGVQSEDLLEIVADRLSCFQAGAFACAENAEALGHVRQAVEILNGRTRARQKRGVEGTNTA
jgi:hypothetical protein